MRYPKYLINAFAILGVASFVFLACSAAETTMNEDPIENNGDNDGNNDGNNNPPIQNNNGKYQIAVKPYSFSTAPGVSKNYTTILNTETGDVSYYYFNGSEYIFQASQNLAN